MLRVGGIAAIVVLCSAGAAAAGSFDGLYVGGIFSRAFDGPSSTLFDDHIGGDPPLSSGSSSSSTYGAQAGYNIQFDRYVLGIEGDWSWGNSKDETAILDDGGPGIDSASAMLKSFGSVRGRAGIVVFDNVLVFGTAGVGLGKADYGFRDADAIAGTARFTSRDTALVFGGGVDLLLGYNFVLSAEYLRYDFNDDVFEANASRLNGGSDIGTNLDSIDTFRLAVSYKFAGRHDEPIPLK